MQESFSLCCADDYTDEEHGEDGEHDSDDVDEQDHDHHVNQSAKEMFEEFNRNFGGEVGGGSGDESEEGADDSKAAESETNEEIFADPMPQCREDLSASASKV